MCKLTKLGWALFLHIAVCHHTCHTSLRHIGIVLDVEPYDMLPDLVVMWRNRKMTHCKHAHVENKGHILPLLILEFGSCVTRYSDQANYVRTNKFHLFGNDSKGHCTIITMPLILMSGLVWNSRNWNWSLMRGWWKIRRRLVDDKSCVKDMQKWSNKNCHE